MKRLGVPESIVHRVVELVVLACLAAPAALAQEEEDELTLPPRLDNVPYEARLAAQPAERDNTLEEVIVTRDNEWRLPDLGSAWRARQADEEEQGRIRANFLPLYDPENPTSFVETLFPVNREMQRVGFIEVFRVRFGGRSED
ncbi:hypothetical protein [Candidatus Rariloculus sp.]|uniref:hypothetical protein n=1 Tax=Candidatus Rariloculus sp. TaxID=3101265 RepID=UPI003D0C2C98